jgi:hypothetical protein
LAAGMSCAAVMKLVPARSAEERTASARGDAGSARERSALTP